MKKEQAIGIIVGLVILASLAGYGFIDKKTTSNYPATTPKTVSTTTNSATNKPATTGITRATVSLHNTKQSCYAIIGDKVYDLTSWIDQHPGGVEAIIGLCGNDGTDIFTKVHGSNEKAQQALTNFFIANLI